MNDAGEFQDGEDGNQKQNNEASEDLRTRFRSTDELVPRTRFFFPVFTVEEHTNHAFQSVWSALTCYEHYAILDATVRG